MVCCSFEGNIDDPCISHSLEYSGVLSSCDCKQLLYTYLFSIQCVYFGTCVSKYFYLSKYKYTVVFHFFFCLVSFT